MILTNKVAIVTGAGQGIGLEICKKLAHAGATATERTLEDEEYEKTGPHITPMCRPARVGDIAATALFLVSEGARHISGQTIVVDGGWSCVSPSPY